MEIYQLCVPLRKKPENRLQGDFFTPQTAKAGRSPFLYVKQTVKRQAKQLDTVLRTMRRSVFERFNVFIYIKDCRDKSAVNNVHEQAGSRAYKQTPKNSAAAATSSMPLPAYRGLSCRVPCLHPAQARYPPPPQSAACPPRQSTPAGVCGKQAVPLPYRVKQAGRSMCKAR
jgi:hypothetical protein